MYRSTIFLLLLPAALASAAPDAFTADDLAMANQEYAALRSGVSVEGKPLTLAGKVYPSGLGSHAVSEMPLTVPEGTLRFRGQAGVDDEVGAGKGSVRFRILSGDKVLWESALMKAGDSPASFDLEVPHAFHHKLYLQADDAGQHDYDHADWVNLEWIKGEQPAPKPARVFSAAEFGIKPNVTDDQTANLAKALEALREAPGSTLKFQKGSYHFWYTGALKRHFHISNHDQPTWHPVGISLADLRSVTLDGQGSTFVFHGQMLPLLVQDSENVTVRGIAIDFSRPHHSQGVITKVEPGAYEMTVDPKLYPHEIRDGWFVHKGEGWEAEDWGAGIVFDGKTHEIVAGTGDFGYKGKLTDLGGGKYRIEKDLAKSSVKAGDRLTMRHSSRPHPAVLLYRAKDTFLDHVDIRQAAGMGILAQRSENIHIDGGGINLAPDTDRYFTTNADATHFSNCKGTIISENGLYEGMMDDAINVHATCLRIEEKTGPRSLRAKYVHSQSVGFEVVLLGETLRGIRAAHLDPCPLGKVSNVRRLSTDEVEITLDSDIPATLAKGDAIENADWFPAVTFRGNTVRNNRARGTLFTTPRPVLVENNTFDKSSGSALLLAGDANGWYESGACGDVVVRGNTFRNNLTSRYQFTEAILSFYPEIPDLKGQPNYYHRNVRIEHNTFETFDVPLLYAISTDGIVFRDNTVTYNRDYPGWKQPPFTFRHCAGVLIEGNRVSPRPAKSWSLDSVKRELMPDSAIQIR